MVKRVETYFGNNGISPLVTTLIRELENIDSWDVTQEGNHLVMHRESTTIHCPPTDMYWLYVYMGRKEIHLSFEERSTIYEICTEIRKQFLAKSVHPMDEILTLRPVLKQLWTELKLFVDSWQYDDSIMPRAKIITSGNLKILASDKDVLGFMAVNVRNIELNEIIPLTDDEQEILHDVVTTAYDILESKGRRVVTVPETTKEKYEAMVTIPEQWLRKELLKINVTRLEK